MKQSSPLKIGVIGAGFSGVAFAANLYRFSPTPVEIILFEKTGNFGVGDAYRTPYPFHLLNVRAKDMSVFENDPTHFVNWLNSTYKTHDYIDSNIPVDDQFVPRMLYGQYLQHLLEAIQADVVGKVRLKLESVEVTDIETSRHHAQLVLNDKRQIEVDKVILALGNNPPAKFFFPVSRDIKCISNPWNYSAVKHIGEHDPVLIVGTGLSMIDAVLSLHHQKHQGPIYAISRHGLLPLPHAETGVPVILMQEHLPDSLRSLTRHLRLKSEYHIHEGGHWQSVVNALRPQLPLLWEKASDQDKKRFLRHMLSYWNIHRHRVNKQLTHTLSELQASGQLTLLAGKILGAQQGKAHIKLRHTHEVKQIDIKWLLNCTGPSLHMTDKQQPLVSALLTRGIAHLDKLNLGFDMTMTGALKADSGKVSSLIYTLGPLRKGHSWECSAVPEIRKQCFDLVKHLLNKN